MRLTLQTQLIDDVAVIRCQGRIVLGLEANALQAELDRLTVLRKKVVLNLAQADYIDSSGLGTLIRVFGALLSAGGELKLCELNPSVSKVLELTNLLTVFSTYSSEREAVEAFSRGRRSHRTSAETSRAKVLCVDTSRDLLAYVSAVLKGAGYEVFTSRYLGEAMTLVNVIRPNVVICGAGIQDLPTGKEAIEKLGASGIQILHLASDFSAAEAGNAGADLLTRLQSLPAA